MLNHRILPDNVMLASYRPASEWDTNYSVVIDYGDGRLLLLIDIGDVCATVEELDQAEGLIVWSDLLDLLDLENICFAAWKIYHNKEEIGHDELYTILEDLNIGGF